MRGRVLLIVSVACLAAAIAFPLGVIASHQFSDVPDSNTFHNDIDAIADAGVTVGCGGGKYCPGDYVTREQMAAFMNRLGALGAGKTPVVNADKVDGLNSTQFLRSDTSRTGQVQCHASGFNGAGHVYQRNTTSTGLLYLPSDTLGIFACPIHLPDGATVTKFSAGIQDFHNPGTVLCRLVRWEAVASTGSDVILANVESGGAPTPQYILLEDTTIAEAVVDNASYAYSVTCLIVAGNGINLGFYGTTTEFQVTGIPVD